MHKAQWMKGLAAACLVLLVASACSSDASTQDSSNRDESGNITEGGDVGVFSLEVGDCFDQPTDNSSITQVAAVPCTDAHDNEVYAKFNIEGGDDAPFPGTDAVSQEAQTKCTGQLFTDYVGVDFQTSKYQATSINPTQETWESDQHDREVVCVATTGDGTQITGSIKDTAE